MGYVRENICKWFNILVGLAAVKDQLGAVTDETKRRVCDELIHFMFVTEVKCNRVASIARRLLELGQSVAHLVDVQQVVQGKVVHDGQQAQVGK